MGGLVHNYITLAGIMEVEYHRFVENFMVIQVGPIFHFHHRLICRECIMGVEHPGLCVAPTRSEPTKAFQCHIKENL